MIPDYTDLYKKYYKSPLVDILKNVVLLIKGYPLESFDNRLTKSMLGIEEKLLIENLKMTDITDKIDLEKDSLFYKNFRLIYIRNATLTDGQYSVINFNRNDTLFTTLIFDSQATDDSVICQLFEIIIKLYIYNTTGDEFYYCTTNLTNYIKERLDSHEVITAIKDVEFAVAIFAVIDKVLNLKYSDFDKYFGHLNSDPIYKEIYDYSISDLDNSSAKEDLITKYYKQIICLEANNL